MIEPTNLCNLHCPICLTGSGYFDDKPRGMMSFKQFKEIVNANKHFLNFIQMSCRGEPFLAQDIAQMIKYAGEKEVSMGFHTNGITLDSKLLKQLKKIIK